MRFDNLETSLNERYVSQEKAIKIATDASEKRLDSMNEFRDTLRDQSKTFITKAELDILMANVNSKFDMICENIKSIQISDAVIAGKASQGQFYIVMGISLIGLLVSVGSIILRVAGM